MLSSWNVRGLNKSGKVKEISSRLKTTKPDIMILIETRVKVGNAKNIRDKLNLYDRYIDNYGKHDNGRIWITWNDSKVDVRLIDSTD
jgi:exonuclease III